ncbi:MAG: zinc ribbon domain-containing protein [Proteobacteria bacterium]|nr:zinc ribbon domain-containing protein [Pseudomonadota bacterium]
MTCPTCRRDNSPARRYCGGCGSNLVPSCTGCSFVNESTDRFCGGCGAGLVAGLSLPAGPAAVAVVAVPAPARGELAELFATITPPLAAPLPETGVSQDDLDRMFGVPS